MSVIKRRGFNYSLVAKLMHLYFNDSIASILDQLRRTFGRDLACHQRFYGSHYTKLKLYYNALVEFKNMWYLGIFRDEKTNLIEETDPWDWMLNFVQQAPTALSRVMECAPTNEKQFFKLRINLPENTYEKWIELREQYEKKLAELPVGDKDLIEEEFIDTDTDIF